jgi:hypothetical protein
MIFLDDDNDFGPATPLQKFVAAGVIVLLGTALAINLAIHAIASGWF